MHTNNVSSNKLNTNRLWEENAIDLALTFGARAGDHDERGAFVHENYSDLVEHRFFSAAIPAELGGGGATYEQMCNVVRILGQHCGSTALSFSMHTHTVCANVFKYLRGDAASRQSLTKITSGELIIATTGANDWLESSGDAIRVEGGYHVTARKRFVSGCLGANILATSAVCKENDGSEILHFAIPTTSNGVEIADNWHAHGMRGTGSHDVTLNEVYVADAAILARRPAGQWHPMWEVILPTALPLICSAYVGLAESATALAIESAKRSPDEFSAGIGEMMNRLTVAQITLNDMIRLNDNLGFTPCQILTSDILSRKAIISAAVKESVELAAEVVGGPGFFRGHTMERILRDVRAINFHPLPIRRQQVFSGLLTLGLNPITHS